MGLFSKLFGSAGECPRTVPRTAAGGKSAKADLDRYFALLAQIKDWQAERRYDRMLDACASSLPLLPSLVREWKREYGKFEISSIPAVEVGCRYWAALNDTDHLQLVARTLSQVPELEAGWAGVLQSAYDDAALAARIREYVTQNDGVLQSQMGRLLGVSGRDTARVINTLVNLGQIVRAESGKTHTLHSAAQ
jgi:hypothetical protein